MATHVVVLTESGDGETGTGRVWYVDETTWQAIVDFLPDQPDESVLYTPQDVEAAERVCGGMLTVEHGDDGG